jgi:Domain of unknown function (DUF3854)
MITKHEQAGPLSLPPLSDKHRHTHEVGSAIAPDILDSSGVHTITHGRQLPGGFCRRQRDRAPGVLYEVPRPNGKKAWVFRPDDPDPDNPGLKYEATCKELGGPGNVLYVHPSQRHLIGDTNVPVIFVEGIKKALSIITAARAAGVEVLVVGILGVWNWMADGKPISDMFDIPVEGRDVDIVYDSDVFSNPDVSDAARRLAGHLIDRGAVVHLSYLPAQADGSKTGADDFLASGHTYGELMALMQLYNPRDLQAERLSRDKKLQAGVDYLWRDWHGRDWMHFVGDAERPNWARGHTARDVKEALIKLAPQIGKLDERGIVIRRTGLRRIAELAAKSAPSAGHALKHLEADGQLEILPPDDKSKARSYRLLVPRAALYSMEEGHTEGPRLEDGSRRCKGLRAPTAPRLRWSSPARKVQRFRDVTPGTRRVRWTRRFHKDITMKESRIHFPDTPCVKRLGPHRCAILDALEAAGGTLTLQQLCEVLHRSRPRDVKRRILPMLEGAGIIEVKGDVVTLAADWLARLGEERNRTGEISYAEEQREKHRKQRKRYREYLAAVKQSPSKAGRENVRKAREKRRGHRRENLVSWVEETVETPLSSLAVAIRDYLDCHPHQARQPAGWIGVTLWADGLHHKLDNPPAETRAAIEELGGAAYLDRKLKEAKGVA